MLMSKLQDEVKALQLCQSKVRAKKLPMEVIDAEYQWCVPMSFFLPFTPCSERRVCKGPTQVDFLFHRGQENRFQGACEGTLPVCFFFPVSLY